MQIQTTSEDAPGAAVWPDREGFLAGLCAGRFHWDLLHPFPARTPATAAPATRSSPSCAGS